MITNTLTDVSQGSGKRAMCTFLASTRDKVNEQRKAHPDQTTFTMSVPSVWQLQSGDGTSTVQVACGPRDGFTVCTGTNPPVEIWVRPST